MRIRTPNFTNIGKRLRDRDQRGAALVEFAIAVPVLLTLLALVFDAGLGYNDARSSSSAARSSARIAALEGDNRLADYRALSALRGKFGDGATVSSIVIYLSDPATNPDGIPPAASDCVVGGEVCNAYSGSVLASLTQASFEGSDPVTGDCIGPDSVWCPLGRRANDGKYLGVAVYSSSAPTIGYVTPNSFSLEDRAVFALYFPPAPTAATPTPIVN